MTRTSPSVFVVDDNPLVREARVLRAEALDGGVDSAHDAGRW